MFRTSTFLLARRLYHGKTSLRSQPNRNFERNLNFSRNAKAFGTYSRITSISPKWMERFDARTFATPKESFLTKPAPKWTKEEVQDFFLNYQGGIFASEGERFKNVTGKELAHFTLEEFNEKASSSLAGYAIFSAINEKTYNASEPLDELRKRVTANIVVGKPHSPSARELQSGTLGAFNRPELELPFSGTHLDLRLLRPFRGEPLPAAIRFLREINQLKVGNRYFGIGIGLSGCGKTTTLFDIAMEHFMIYMECTDRDDPKFEPTQDQSFSQMMMDLKELKGQPNFGRNTLRRVRAEFIARVWYLLALLDEYPNLTPTDFLLGQLNGGSETITQYAMDIHSLVQGNLQSLLLRSVSAARQRIDSRHRLLVAIDEASVASKLFHGSFTSDRRVPKGLLTPIVRILRNSFLPLIFAGTGLRLLDGESIQSDIGKLGKLDKVTAEFKQESNPMGWISKLIDTSGCEKVLEDFTFESMVTGRLRFAGSVINQLWEEMKKLPDSKSRRELSPQRKAMILRTAMENAIKMNRDRMSNRLVEACEGGKRKDLVAFLKSISRHYLRIGRKIVFNPKDFIELQGGRKVKEVDLVNTGLCHLHPDERGNFLWVLSEDLAVSAIIDAVGKMDGTNFDVKELKKELANVIANRPTDTGKGKQLEEMVSAEMSKWSGMKLADLPFVKANLEIIPKWMTKCRFTVKRNGDCFRLGYKSDLKVLEAWKKGELLDAVLHPENITGPDRLYLSSVYLVVKDGKEEFYDEEPPEGTKYRQLFFVLSIGCKFYKGEIPEKTRDMNRLRSDPMNLFIPPAKLETGDRNVSNHKKFLKLYPKTFDDDYSNLLGILTVLVELSGEDAQVQKSYCDPILDDPTDSRRRCYVHINMMNADDSFEDREGYWAQLSSYLETDKTKKRGKE